jgi:hypothetical protein
VRFVLGRFIPVQCRELAHQGFVLRDFVGVDGLGALAEVVEAGELFGAATGEGAFAGVFSAGRGR